MAKPIQKRSDAKIKEKKPQSHKKSQPNFDDKRGMVGSDDTVEDIRRLLNEVDQALQGRRHFHLRDVTSMYERLEKFWESLISWRAASESREIA